MTTTPKRLGRPPKETPPEQLAAAFPHGICAGISFSPGTIAPLVQRCKKAALMPGQFCSQHALTVHQQRYLLALLSNVPEWERKMREAARQDGVTLRPGVAVVVAPVAVAAPVPAPVQTTPAPEDEPSKEKRPTRFALPGIPDYFDR